MKHPLAQDQTRDYPTEVVLSDLAAQNGCDGEPYDQMQEAAEEIRALKAKIKELRGALDDAVVCIEAAKQVVAGTRYAARADGSVNRCLDRANAALARTESNDETADG